MIPGEERGAGLEQAGAHEALPTVRAPACRGGPNTPDPVPDAAPWEGPDAGAPAPAPSLPCLFENNCTKGKLTPYRKRQAETLALNVKAMVQQNGLERIGFLTLTFPDYVTDPKDAQRRWHSFRTHVVRKRYGEAVKVFERCKSGRIHYHLLLVMPGNILAGFNFAEVKRGNYRSVGKLLRDEWAFLRSTLPKYGFGRHEMLPIKSNADGASRYIAKYLTKAEAHPIYHDVGVRRVEYIQGARRNTTHWAWTGPYAWVFRRKLMVWALGKGIASYDEIYNACGPRWFWRHKEAIMATVLPPETVYPTVAHVEAAGLDACLPEEVRAADICDISGIKPEPTALEFVNMLLVECSSLQDQELAEKKRTDIIINWTHRRWVAACQA